MRKKIIFAIAIITLIISIFMCVKINATSELIATYDISATTSDSVTASLYQVDNNYTLVISGTGKMKDYDKRSEIPWSEYSGDWSTKLTKAIIEDGVENIGNNLFTLQKGLREVEIAETVTHIGAGVFSYCPLTEYFVIPDTVTSLGEGAFSNTGIVKIKLSNGLKEIQKSAFEDANIAEVEIPNTVEVIGEKAFYLCTELTYVYIPESVKTIKERAFTNCKKLECVEIASGVTTIEGAAFDYCGNLTKITIPSNVENIGSDTGDYWSIVDKSENITVYFKSGSAAEEYFAQFDKTTVVDDNKPVINSVDITETDWTNQDVTITVNANDDLSGLSKYAYSFDGGITWQEENYKIYNKYTEGIVIKVKDCLYNTETYEEEITVYIDKVNPKITNVEISETDWTNQDVTITVNATDDLSGFGTEAYSFDGGITWQEENFKVYEKNTNGIEIQIKDKAGNVTKHTESINIENIDKVDPEIRLVSGEREACLSTVLTINATDDLSGFGTESYSFDNGATWQDSNQTEYKETTENIVIQVRDKAGNTTTYEKIDIAIGHNYDEEIIAPTCTEDGYTTHICTRCDDNYKDNYTDATGHTELIDERVEPTDIQTGLTQGSHCSVCGETIVAQEIIPSLKVILQTWDISATEEDNVMANLYSDSTLVISGTGNMKDYDFFNNTAPWYDNYRGNIKNVEIKNEVKNIGDYAFFDCIFLEKIIISDKVIYIGNYAFVDCLNLVKLEISSSVNTIGEQAFYCCRNLSDITIPEKVMNIGDSAFDRCSGLININVDENNNYYASENGILFNKEKSKIIKYPEGKMETEYLIPNTVVSVSIRAFSGCTNLINIMIPKEVKSIENNAFYGCGGLININVDENNNYYASEDGILFNKEKSKIIKYPEGKTEGEYIIPDSVKIIGYDSFSGCSNLSSIVILEGVEEINSSAFNICSNLSNITIPSSVRSIGITVFFGCEKLSRINVYCNSYSEEYVTQNYSDKLSIVHTYEDTITEPTCTEQGYTTHTCTRCNDSYVDTHIEAIGHSYSEEWTEDVVPTCTEVGSKSHHCTRETCDSKINITAIEALNHEYKIIDSSEAVCEQGGKITYECSNCKDTYDENVPAKGHTEVIDAAVEATCIEKGKTEGKHCSVCNKVLIAQEEIASIGHNFGDWTVTKAATCTEAGLQEKVCSVCEDKQTEDIAALGHSYGDWVVDIEPTCTESGEKSKHCTRCSDSKVEITTIDPLGHSFGAWVIDKEATYEEEGHKYRVCTNCNTEREEQVIPNLTEQDLEVQTTYTVKEQDGQKFAVMSSAKDVQEILSNITSNKHLEIVDKSGNVIDNTTQVGTGAKVVEKQSREVAYTIVVKGDVDGDAKVTFLADIVKINDCRIGIGELTTTEMLAGDINNDGKISFLSDIVAINDYRIGITTSL